MLPARFVRHFGKAPEQLLEDLSHGMVVDRLRMQVHGGELLDEQEQPVVLMQLLHRLVELEILDDVVHVL